MEIGKTQHTREVVRLELAGRILADLLRLSSVLGMDAAHRALGKPVPALPGRVPLSMGRMPYDVKLEDIDVDQFPLGQVVMAMYDYAYEQRFPVGVQMYVFQAEMELVEDFVISLNSELIGLYMNDPVHMCSAGEARWRALPDLYAVAHARLSLDMGEDMTLEKIALLAGMAEKSVRNALTGSGESRLRCQSGETSDWVDNDEARRWLSLRRGFVPTRFAEMSAEVEQHPVSLNSLFEIGSYIHQRWSALGKTPQTVHQELDWPDARFDYLNSITGTPQKIDPKDCGDLARSLSVSESWFTAQIMRNLFPHQVELLLKRDQQDQKVEPPSRQSPPAADNDRISTRVRFILHDETELFPIRMKNRDTGKVAFRLSEGGTGGNTKERTSEVENEDEMVDLVCKQGMAVRLVSADGSRQGLYRRDGRSVRNVELDGVMI